MTRITCNQCNPSVVSTGQFKNVFLHEAGCPNDGKKWDNDREEWVQYVPCHICGFDVEVGEECCNDSTDEEE